MSKLRQIALNNNAGAFVDISATIPTRCIELQEDEGTTTQGIQEKNLMDAFATTNTHSFTSQPVTIPNIRRYGNRGPLLGMPAQNTSGAFNFTAATKLVSARSNGGSGTTLRFIENE